MNRTLTVAVAYGLGRHRAGARAELHPGRRGHRPGLDHHDAAGGAGSPRRRRPPPYTTPATPADDDGRIAVSQGGQQAAAQQGAAPRVSAATIQQACGSSSGLQGLYNGPDRRLARPADEDGPVSVPAAEERVAAIGDARPADLEPSGRPERPRRRPGRDGRSGSGRSGRHPCRPPPRLRPPARLRRPTVRRGLPRRFWTALDGRARFGPSGAGSGIVTQCSRLRRSPRILRSVATPRHERRRAFGQQGRCRRSIGSCARAPARWSGAMGASSSPRRCATRWPARRERSEAATRRMRSLADSAAALAKLMRKISAPRLQLHRHGAAHQSRSRAAAW